MLSIQIGADPEVFIREGQNGRFFSAHNLIPGTKGEPVPTDFGAVQHDGVAAEFNIKPAKNANIFAQRIKEGLDFIDKSVKSINPSYTVSITPTANYSELYFSTLPEEARALGCEPDYNAYTGKMNEKPHTTHPFRTAAGHVHIGWLETLQNPPSEALFETCCQLTKQLDRSLFLPSLLFDKDNQRRTLYGAPGAFRPKPYGVEYRVLSNKWLQNQLLTKWVFNTALRSLRDLIQGVRYYDVLKDSMVSWFAQYSDDGDIPKLISDLATQHPNIIQLPFEVKHGH